MKISYSAFDCYNRCPRQYKLNYIDRVPTPKRAELYFGGLIHEIVQYALKKDPILPPLEELINILKQKWQPEIFSSENDADQYFDFGRDMITKFHANYKPGLRNIVAVEKRFQIPLNEKHVLSGVIDRIDKLPFGAYEVIDYKTSKALPTKDEVDKDKQLCLYNFAVENLWPEAKDVRLTLYFLKHNSQITTSRRPDQVEDIKAEIISVAETIEKDNEFVAKDNALCNWCDFQKECSLHKHKFAPDEEKEEENIDNMVSDYIAAHKTIEELEPKIHQHFDKKALERYYHKDGIITRGKSRRLTIKKNY